MKFAIFPLFLLALVLVFPTAPTLASEAVPFRFLSAAVTVQEPDSVARLQVVRADDADHPVKVDFLTQPISATPGADYTPVAGTLIFAPGEHFKLIEIPILNDGFTESGETFSVVLTNATELGISETFGVATINIRDNDRGFSFEASTYSLAENQSEVLLNVRRGADRPGTITVDYAVESDSATAGIDYLPASGTLSFGPNDPIQSIRVPIVDDFLREPQETIRVVLSNPSAGATLGSPSTALVRVIDNDPGFRFTNFNYNSSTYSVGENQGEAVLYVDRGTDAPGESSVEYSVEPISATPDLDYTAVHGTLIFATNHFSGIIRVPILNDGLKESVETFRVVLSNPSAGAQLGTPSVATVRIENNDTGFSFSGGASYSVDENGRAFLNVYRGSDLPAEVSVEYTVEAVSATPDLDYTPVSGKLVFTTNTYSQNIEVPILDDPLKEETESFRVVLRNPSPGTSLGTPGVATVRILSNDPGFNLGTANYYIPEGAHEVNIGVYRGADPVGEARVDYSVEAFVPDSATPGVDFTPVSGTLTFLDKENFKTIQIPIIDDTLQEGPETFQVILSNPSPGSFLGAPATATVRITENLPAFYVQGNFSVAENSGEAALTIFRNSVPTNTVSVEYSVEPGTASPDLDYTPVHGTVLFAAGETFKAISVPILNDMISEGNESFGVVLSNPSAGSFIGTPNRANVIIKDDDIGFVFECAPGDPNCGSPPENIGAAKVDVVIRGDFKLTNTVSVDFVTESAKATANLDFLATSGTLTFAPGETRKTISIPLLNDGLFEAPETFRIALRDPVGLTQATALPRFTFAIQDNERGYWIETNTEDGRLIVPGTAGDVLINIRREGDFNYGGSIDFRTSEFGEQGSTALPGVDFVAAARTITFAPGETNKAIALRLTGAHHVRVVEQFFIELSNPTDGLPINSLRWIEIRPDERNLLQVDPGFSPEVRYARGTDLQVLPDGRIVMATPLAFLTGEDGLGIVRLLRDGTLDPSFAITKTFGFNLLALQTNGQVLVSGTINDATVLNGATVGPLARLNANGSFDSTFLAQLSDTNGSVTAVALQSDGKILVATDDNLLVRLNPNGSLDSSFQRMTNVPISRIILDKSGRPLISGGFTTVANKPRPGLARLLLDGSLDPSFLGDWQRGLIYRFELEAGGTLLITYYDNNPALILARLTQDGQIDPTLKADARFGSFEYSFFPLSDGKVLVSEQKAFGEPGIDSGIVSRLNADGSLDDSFSGETYTVTFLPTGGWSSPKYSITADPAGDLLIKGDIATVNGIPAVGFGRLLLNEGSIPVSVDPASAQVLETNGFVNVTLVRAGNTSSAYTVNWGTDGGTAVPGVDFLASSGTVTFAPGESDHAIALQLVDNQQPDGDRTVRLRLTTLDGLVLPSATFTIANDDLGFVPGGSYAFSNGRFLMNMTGYRTRPDVRIQRTTDLLNWWEEWMWINPSSDDQIIDSDTSPDSGKRKFYRLIEY